MKKLRLADTRGAVRIGTSQITVFLFGCLLQKGYETEQKNGRTGDLKSFVKRNVLPKLLKMVFGF